MCEIHLISEWIHFSNWYAMDKESNYIERVIKYNLNVTMEMNEKDDQESSK